MDDSIADYVLDLGAATRDHADVFLGASTRASLSLYRAAQALALYEGRDYVVPDDVKRLAGPVMAHRLLLRRRGSRPATARPRNWSTRSSATCRCRRDLAPERGT